MYDQIVSSWRAKHIKNSGDLMSALEAWDVSQDLKPLIAFLKKQTVKTWSRLIGAS